MLELSTGGGRSRCKSYKLFEDSSSGRFQVSNLIKKKLEPASSKLNTLKFLSLSHTKSARFRTGISEREVALIISSVLQYVWVVTADDKILVIHKNKVRTEKQKF